MMIPMNDKWYTNREVIALLKAPRWAPGGKLAAGNLWMNAFNIPYTDILYRGQDTYQQYVRQEYKGSWITDVRFPPGTRNLPSSIGSMIKDKLEWQINFGEDDPDE